MSTAEEAQHETLSEFYSPSTVLQHQTTSLQEIEPEGVTPTTSATKDTTKDTETKDLTAPLAKDVPRSLTDRTTVSVDYTQMGQLQAIVNSGTTQSYSSELATSLHEIDLESLQIIGETNK